MLSPEQQEAKELVADFWAIIEGHTKELVLVWMEGRGKYSVPLVAKQCASIAVDLRLSDEHRQAMIEYWTKVKQALIAM